MIDIDKYNFEKLELDLVYEHTFTLNATKSPPLERSLGYISRTNNLSITIGTGKDDIEIEIEQSISSFNDSKQLNRGSTGFMTWSVTPLVIEWLLKENPTNPFYGRFEKSTVVELGSGISGLFGCTLALQCSKFICTDQAPLLKLLKKNIANNVHSFNSSTILRDQDKGRQNGKKSRGKKTSAYNTHTPTIEVIEYDWEASTNEQILADLDNQYPDFIISCDTIYNPYLIPHLVSALDDLSGDQTHIIIALQLRESSLLESFLEESLGRFNVYYVTDEILSSELKQGYCVYYLTK